MCWSARTEKVLNNRPKGMSIATLIGEVILDGDPLIDLALIVSCELDAAMLSAALHAESARRNIRLPTALVAPASNWSSGYRAYARKTRIDAALHDLESALTHVGMCMNPLSEEAVRLGGGKPDQGWRD